MELDKEITNSPRMYGRGSKSYANIVEIVKDAVSDDHFNVYATPRGNCYILSEKKYNELITKACIDTLDKAISIVESKKLPIPNPYGKWVKNERYNEVMNEIIEQFKKERTK